jgi:hypothetical protein
MSLLSDLESSITELKGISTNPEYANSELLTDVALILELDKKVYAVLQNIKKLKTFAENAAEIVPEKIINEFKRIEDDAVPFELLNLLTLIYLESNHEFLYRIFQLCGFIKLESDLNKNVIKVDQNSDYAYRSPYLDRRIVWDNIRAAFTDIAYFQVLYGFNLDPANPSSGNIYDNIATKAFPAINMLLSQFDSKVTKENYYSYTGINQDIEDSINEGTLSLSDKSEIIGNLKRSFSAYNRKNTEEERSGISLAVTKSELDSYEFLIYLFLGGKPLTDTIYYKNQYFKYAVDGDIAISLGDSKVKYLDELHSKSNLKAAFETGRINIESPVIFIGDLEGTYFKISDYTISGFIAAELDKYDFGIIANFKNVKLVLKAPGDGFLDKVFPDKGIVIDFDFSIGYSKVRGFHFSESGTLTTEIAIYKTFIGITIETINLSIVVKDGEIKVLVGVTFKVDLDSFKIRIKRPGLKIKHKKPKTRTSKNDWGFGGFDFGFDWPKGLDLSLHNKWFKGAGGVDFDIDLGRYSGFLDIRLFEKVAVKALLILDTKLPSGKEGYSLVLIIQAVGFNPIELGLGFSLTGIGGLLGYNRTMDVNALRDGIRTNAINSIFLPGDLIDNAPKIIKDLVKFFPIKEDQFMVGPLGQITWGTKSMLTLDFGIIIEFSKPFRIAIPGVLKVLLPDPEEPLITLQVNFIGIIDFDKKYLSFDACLFDSKIQGFAINGDMAIRLNWGDNPFFLLTVGGFHPAYTPPPLNLPVLRRLQIQIANEEKLKLYFETYFALTSNSVQLGSKVYGYAKTGGFEAEGYVAFDVLFIFSPFSFTAALGIAVAVKYDGREFLSAYLSLKLSGPAPWKADGVAAVSIELLCFTFKADISFNVEFGDAAKTAKAKIEVTPMLLEALKAKANWTSVTTNEAMVNILSAELESGNLFVQPNGSLQFVQNVMPANIGIEKFGNELPDVVQLNFKDFSVKDYNPISNNFTVNNSPAKSNFPLGQFINLSEQDKLNASKSFQSLNSGFTINEPNSLNVPYYNAKAIEYERIIVDNGVKSSLTGSIAISDGDFKNSLRTSAIAKSDLSKSYKNIQSEFLQKMVTKQAQYFVADEDLANIESTGMKFDSPYEAELFMKSAIKSNPSLNGNVMVLNTMEV